MKRIITAVLALTLMLSIVTLASCAEKDNQNQNNTIKVMTELFLTTFPMT